MTPEQWRQIEDLYNRSLDLPESRRAGFLRDECAGNNTLRSEVERLLISDHKAGSFLEQPALQSQARHLARSAGTSWIGKRVHNYEFRSLLGSGGMAEVYRARDVKLQRDVAIKVLPASFSDDPDRVRRFEQEARTLASLNHPYIASIYGLEESDGRYAIVLELVEGPTLADRFDGGPVALREALRIAREIAEALEAAHEKGIVHRDLKPANIKLTPAGTVKVLDFGLAKAFDTEKSGMSDSRVLTRTGDGVVLGTPSYMSPEQARGQGINRQTDIWGFGCVLYQMLTGDRAFSGDTVSDTLVAVLEHEPNWQLLPESTPAAVRTLIERCLRKNPKYRLHDIADARIELEHVSQNLESPVNRAPGGPKPASVETMSAPEQAAGSRRGLQIFAVGILLAALVGTLLVWRGIRGTVSRNSDEQGTVAVERITTLGTVIDAVVSPDGKYVAYVTSDNNLQGLWIRQLASGSTLGLVPPERVGYWGIDFSPDGNSVYYAVLASGEPDRALFRIPSLGGTPRKLLNSIESKPSFSPDGRRLAYVRGDYPESGASSLMVANVDGSDVHALATRRPPEFLAPIFFTAPAWSPDGKTIICPMERRDGPTVGTLLAINSSDGKTSSSFPHYEWSGVGQAAWLPDGTGVITVAASPDNNRRQLWWVNARRSERRLITNDLLDYRTVTLPSDSSSLLAVAADATASIWVVPMDAPGDARRISTGRYDGLSGLAAVRGKRILYRAVDGGTASIWIMDENGEHRRQVTVEGTSSWPSPTPDAKDMVFVREGAGLWRLGLDGQNLRSIPNTLGALNPQVTTDGKSVVYSSVAKGSERLWKAPLDGGSPTQILDSYSNKPSVSPDGRQIAFFWEGEQAKIVLAVMPLDGTRPTFTFPVFPTVSYATVRWMPDGRALLHNTHVGDRANIWLHPLSGGSARQVTHFADQNILDFDVTADGKSLIVVRGILSRDAVMVHHFR